MPDYKVTFSVQQQSGSAKTTSGSVAEATESAAQIRRSESRSKEPGGKPTANLAGAITNLNRSVQLLSREIQALARSNKKGVGTSNAPSGGDAKQAGLLRVIMGSVLGGIKNMGSSVKSLISGNQQTTAIQRQQLSVLQKISTKGGAGGGGGGGGPLAGGLRSATPILALLVSAFTMAAKAYTAVGREVIGIARGQKGTYGVTGKTFLSSSKSGYFAPGEMAQLEYQRRMSSGSFTADASTSPLTGGGKYGKFSGQGAEMLAHKFGMQGSQVGSMLGTMQRVVSGTGGPTGALRPYSADVLQKTVATLAKEGGAETDIPAALQLITSNLESAVRDGINSSSLAQDLAGEIAMFSRSSEGNNIKHAMEVAKTMSGVRDQARRGKYGGDITSYRMMQGAQSALMDEKNSALRNMIAQHAFEGTDIGAGGGSELLKQMKESGHVRTYAAQRLMGMSPESIMPYFLKNLIPGLNKEGGGNLTGKEIAAAVTRIQGGGFGALSNKTDSELETIIRSAVKAQQGTLVQKMDEAEVKKTLTKTYEMPGKSLTGSVLKADATRSAYVAKIGGNIANSILQIDLAMAKLAGTLDTAGLGSLMRDFNTMIADSARVIDSSIRGIMTLIREARGGAAHLSARGRGSGPTGLEGMPGGDFLEGLRQAIVDGIKEALKDSVLNLVRGRD